MRDSERREWCYLLDVNSILPPLSSVYSGPADPIHGTALFQKVRNTAQVGYILWLFSLTKNSCCTLRIKYTRTHTHAPVKLDIY